MANADGRLTPKMAALLSKIEQAQNDQPRMYEQPAAQARAAYARGAEVLDLPRAPLAVVRALSIPTRDGASLPARLYAQREPNPFEPLPLLLYFHGGGFTVGSIETHDSLCRQLCLKAECAVLSVDYRLAPEHRFPTAAHDAFDALNFLIAEGGALGFDMQNIALGGDSAGGTIAAATALFAAQQAIPIKLQLLFYPGTCAHQELPSHAEFAHGYLIEKAHIDWFFANYIDVKDREDWRFAPLCARSIKGVAPAWVGVAELDPVRDDGLAWAAKLEAAGIAAESVIYKGVAHDFIKMGRSIPEAVRAHDDAAAALKKAFSDG